MPSPSPRHPFAGLRVTSLGTLASRILGMVRDVATAAVFGLEGGGVMDAFVVAFRIPNLFRRLLGEGALAASYLPVFTNRLEKDPRAAWQLVSVTLTWLAVLLLALLVASEALLAWAGWQWAETSSTRLVVGLTATMMPYMVLICLTAQLSATLYALSHFAMPALSPVTLNVCWLAGLWLVAPHFAPDLHAQAYVLAVSVIIAGVMQLGMQLPPLFRLGFRFDYNWQESRGDVGQIVRATLPMMFGLAVTQINTLADALLAWGLASTPESGQTIAWLPGTVAYPMTQGAAAAVYYGERLYQFPLGILGMAVATVIFPLLSRHAARGDHEQLGADLTLGLRLVLLLALPASAGLMLLAEPVARLLFERGAFTSEDTLRTARMIACYASAVWAYCASPVLIRGYYALGDRTTPVKLGAAMVLANLGLNLLLIWPLAEVGLAVSTALTAAVQAVLLAVVISRRTSPLNWSRLGRTALVAAAATAVMGAACLAALHYWPPGDGLAGRLSAVCGPLALSVVVYFAVIRIAGRGEMSLLVAGRRDRR